MRRSILAFVVLLSTSAMAQDNFPDTPKNHWVYESVAKMKKEGFYVGYPDGLGRRRPPSRYEFAVGVYATYAHKNGMLESLLKGPAEGEPAEQYRGEVVHTIGWYQHIDALRKMAKEFDHELRAFGVGEEPDIDIDCDKLESLLGKLHRKFFSQFSGASGKIFDDGVPGNQWAHVAKAKMRRLGVLVGDPMNNFNARSKFVTRYEWAVMIHATYAHLDGISNQLAAEKSDDIIPIGLREVAADLALFIKEFHAELAALGVDVAAMAKDLSKLEANLAEMRDAQLARRLFPDVPRNHWAADALGVMRKEGLIVGYPNGKFGG